MTPPKPDHPTWNIIAKWAVGIVGAILAIVVGWAARAAERQATAFDQLKDAVYGGQTKAAVLETKVEAIDNRVRKLESRYERGDR